MSNAAVATGSASEVIEVGHADLPLSCPMPDAPVWNMHPRVYLPIENEPSGEAVCPYCGARYRLRSPD
ncbi:MAG: zinc-finger domain-containing protein [Sphingobacteriia bacterium]|nr:zinc-finger domain-containing protein [Sphingobacteriia bacterium]NCC39987.1 zinc-finger domain-containing protein [Gammaproteobacteria bacterium]